METKNCLQCGIEFNRPKGKCESKFLKQKFCSKQCVYKNKIGKPTWNKGLKGVQEPYWLGKKRPEMFDILSKIHKGRPARNKGIKTEEYIKEKQRLSAIGRHCKEKNPMRKGGVTSANNLIRTTAAYKQRRMSVFKRDWFTCKECGYKGKDIQAHHIKKLKLYPEEIYNINNGITLCVDCHNKTRNKEQLFEDRYLALT